MQVCFDIGKKSINHGNKFVYFIQQSEIYYDMWKTCFEFFAVCGTAKTFEIVDDLNFIAIISTELLHRFRQTCLHFHQVNKTT